MGKLLQIYEEDLATLEATLPELMWFQPDLHTSRQKTQWRRVQQIIQNIRWNYGPPDECHRVEVDPPHEDDGDPATPMEPRT